MKCEYSEIGIYNKLLDFYHAPQYERYIEKWSYNILIALIQLPEVQNNEDLYTNVLLIFIAFLRENFKNNFEPSKKLNNLSNKDRKIAQNLLKSCIF